MLFHQVAAKVKNFFVRFVLYQNRIDVPAQNYLLPQHRAGMIDIDLPVEIEEVDIQIGIGRKQVVGIAANMQLYFASEAVNIFNQLFMPFFYKKIVGFRVDLGTNSIAHTNDFAACLNLGFRKIFGCNHTFVHQPVGKIGFHHQLHHHVLHPGQITCLGQGAFNPPNDRNVSLCFFRKNFACLNSVKRTF